jgi:hypothetical protein
VETVPFDALDTEVVLDFVKLDVQGYELHVLEGLKTTLDRSAGVVVAFEFWQDGLRQCGTEPSQLLRFFLDRGYVIARIGRQGGVVPLSEPLREVRPRGLRERYFTTLLAFSDKEKRTL